MRALHSCHRVIALLLGVAAFAAFGCAFADPPTRVARVGYVAGNVSFSPAGENDWVQARLNRSLTTGDRLWTDRASRVELQVGGAVIRMGENTSLTLLNLDDNVAQVQLDQGTLNVRVRQLAPRQSVEVATPNLAFTTRRAGSYRIEVDSMDDATAIVVRSGQGEVYGERAAYAVDSRQAYRFAGTGLRSYEYVATPRPSEFERWANERDRRAESSASARYVSRDLIGYEDLDANGTWRNEPGYGNVWSPTRVSADWTPYRDGHWAWIDPWGWTWVDDAPWGFAVSHYGRWANLRGRWAWVPGPPRSRAVYAPALVAFVGGNNFQLSRNVGGVAWFPLAPREVYRPSYPVSRGYFDNVNRSNTIVNNTTITNVYNNRNVTNVYANRQVQGAVVAVPATAFVQSQPVSRAAVRLSRETAASAPVSAVAAVAPVQQSVRGGATAAGSPPADMRARERRAVVRSAPPAARAGFAAQERELTAKPGTPLAPAARAALKPAAPVPAPNVVVAAPLQSAPPKALPPVNAPDGKPGERDRRDDRRADGERQRDRDRGAKGDQPAQPAPTTPAPQAAPAQPQAAPPQPAPATATPPKPVPVQPQATPAQAAPAVPTPPRDDKGAKGERQRDRDRGTKGDQPAQPAAIPPAPQAAPAQPAPATPPKPVPVQPQATPAQAAPAVPAAPPQRDDRGTKGERQRDREQGGKGEQGTKGDQPAKSTPPPVVPAQPAAPAQPAPLPPKAAPVQSAPPAPASPTRRDEKGAKGEPPSAIAIPPAPAKPAPAAAPASPPPAPVAPKPEPAAVPVKPAPPPPPPVKPAPAPPPVQPVPAPAPVPAPVPPPPPKPEPAPAARPAPVAPPPPVKPAPPPPPPVKPVPVPAPAPAPAPVPPKPEPPPAAKPAPVPPPVAAPQSPPPKPASEAGKQDDKKGDRKKREEDATKKGDEQEEKKK